MAMHRVNTRLVALEKMFAATIRACRARGTDIRHRLIISRVYSSLSDDADLDDAPEALVGARLHPRHPLGGSAIALPEPDEERFVEAVGSVIRH